MGRPPEVWKKIEWAKPRWGHYEVSTEGRVRHVFPKKPAKLMNLYDKAYIKKGSRHQLVKIGEREHKITRMVWETFVGPIPKDMRIVHKNGLYTDNSLMNLKMVSVRDIGTMYGRMQNRGRRTVARIDRKVNILNVYSSARQAAREYGYLSYESILERCHGVIKRDAWLPDGTTFVFEDDLYSKRGMKKYEHIGIGNTGASEDRSESL